MIENVTDMVSERLSAWYDANNNTFPENVLYYRDSVSDSQYFQVLEDELPQIKAAFEEFAKQHKLKENPSFKLTAVVVTKRHHT
ncbi:Piwi domain-containing protein [Clohesyomyces aquaticus]|uniref:Piwi domain-containing protein n=1 Tax=Clohesyomyces aquaticus TaxID=1231657 RepID=A0A1Y1Y343_9PLEO|nr:Piwi domain-containing protein [Clohesyomyces aquaticus]